MSARGGFRADIEGLRTIAITSVVLYHAGVPAVSGGFIGVDLFFVLSGFLITGLLLRELEITGTIRLREFWARRARRLLPAASIVLILTGAMSFVLLPETVRSDTALAITAATAYVSNWYFAASSLDYLNAEDAPSPVLHFWSLGVEEQFYALWPIALLVLFLILKRFQLRPRYGIAVFAVVVWGLSFWASLHYSNVAQPIAFFSSPTRFWQLATGALLAVGVPWIRGQRRAVLVSLQTLGLAATLYSVFEMGTLIERGYSYPGVVALIPTIGSALLVAGGTRLDSRVTPIERVLHTPLFQWVGGLSYSWYLWHWPVLVFWQLQFGETSVQANLLVTQLALALAWITHQLVENPIRFARPLRNRPEASLAIGGIWMAFSIVVASLLSMSDASHAEAAGVATFYPLPSVARQDVSKVYGTKCVVQYHDVEQPRCVFGDEQATKRMVLIGDSHAASVFPAFDAAAKTLSYQLDVRIKLGCTVAEVDQWHFKFNNPFNECSDWRAQQIDDLVANPADVVVVVNANNPTPPVFANGELLDVPSGRVAWIRGYASTLRKLRDAGSQVIMLRDNPRVPGNIADCVASHMDNPAACNYERRYGLPDPAADVLAARAVPGVRKMDLSDAICDRNTCYAVRNHILAWQKGNHYTATFADSLSKKTTDKLRKLLGLPAA